jgi:hypothetical protein
VSPDPATGSRVLDEEALARIHAYLAPTDVRLAADHPGPSSRRQPVHTVYVPADQPAAARSVAPAWGAAALELTQAAGGLEQVCQDLGLDEELVAQVAPRAERKLRAEPVEDLRIDFEDGYHHRDDASHDADVVRAVHRRRADEQDGTATQCWGVRFPCFEADTRARGLRTLDLTVGELIGTGGLPDGLRLTFPKVSTATQVEALVMALEEIERGHGLPPGRLTFEIQVEVPQLILGAEGTVELARAVRAGQGRVTGLHYGTYDYSAALQVAAAHQALDHPVADQAKAVMQLVVAGTDVELSDGSTNVTPTGDPAQRAAAWRLHHRLVSRSLRQGIFQGWDMHPGHLVTRYVATYAFYRHGLGPALDRVGRYARQVGGEVMDEPATVRALAGFLRRGLACGAVDEDEVRAATGLDGPTVTELARPRSDTAALVAPRDGTTEGDTPS